MRTKNTDILQCKKDILYLVSDIENWINKPYLYTAIISTLTTNIAFNYDKEISIKAYEEMTDTQIKIMGDKL